MIAPHTLTLGDSVVTYRTCGSGPDILLLHGWVSSSRMWAGLMTDLAPNYRTWALDLMGFGDSSNGSPSRELSLEDQLRHIVEFCEVQHIQPYGVIGHSMGGTLALKFALDHPGTLQRLVAIAPVVSGKIAFNLHELLITPFGQALLPIGSALWLPVMKLTPLVAFASPFLGSEAVARGVEDCRKATPGAAHGGLRGLVGLRLEERLSEVKIPTLIICGSQDLTVPPSEGRLAAHSIHNAQLLELSNCHHSPVDEDPVQVSNAIRGFLDGKQPLPFRQGLNH